MLNLTNINNVGRLEAACFLFNGNNNFIVTSNCNYVGFSEPIKIFDFQGNKLNEIKDSDIITSYIDIYYDIRLNKNYIITGNQGFSVSYDYESNKIYKYYKDNDADYHISLTINNSNDQINLIDSSVSGFIRIWYFHSSILLKKINISNNYRKYLLYGICLWNKEYLFVGTRENEIILINLKNGEVIKQIDCKNGKILAIRKIIHSKYGQCLISFGTKGKIQQWIIN